MNTSAGTMDGTLVKCKQAWLITWDWTGDHAKVENRFVALLNYRYSGDTVARIVEHIYVSSQFALHEQLAYAKNPKSNPYHAQHGVVEVGKETRERLSLPPTIPSSDTMICGGNPWLWARIVHDLEAYADENGVEHLRWKEQHHPTWENGQLKSEWEECHLALGSQFRVPDSSAYQETPGSSDESNAA